MYKKNPIIATLFCTVLSLCSSEPHHTSYTDITGDSQMQIFQEIIKSAKDFRDAIQQVKQQLAASPAMSNFLNNDARCDQLIKLIAAKGGSELEAAAFLNIPCAVEWIAKKMQKEDVDDDLYRLYFTYLKKQELDRPLHPVLSTILKAGWRPSDMQTGIRAQKPPFFNERLYRIVVPIIKTRNEALYPVLREALNAMDFSPSRQYEIPELTKALMLIVNTRTQALYPIVYEIVEEMIAYGDENLPPAEYYMPLMQAMRNAGLYEEETSDQPAQAH